MKKEYIKPTLLVIKTEPSQILAGSQGEVVPGVDTNGDGIVDDRDDIGFEEELDPGVGGTKGGLWDEYTW